MESELYGRELNKGEFILREQIGKGGFGDVYRAEQPKLGRVVVVKVLRRVEGLALDGGVIRRFLREAQIASRLGHPYAAQIHAFGAEHDGLIWIAMEMVDGAPLDRYLAEHGPLSIEQAVPLFESVADVVQTAHDSGIVHRDLKPANIMVIERAGKLIPKLLDFGLARMLDEIPDDGEAAYLDNIPTPLELPRHRSSALADHQSEPTTRAEPCTGPTARPPYRDSPYRRPGRPASDSCIASGSPPYMAPEQWTGSRDVGPPADIYAIGVTVYEALAGRRPFGPFDELASGRYSDAHQRAPVPRLGDGFPPALDRFFQCALAKRPEDRFATVLELASALRAVLESRLRTQVRVAARQWEDRGRPHDLLWRGEVLADLEQRLRHPDSDRLTGLESAFVEASRIQAEGDRRRAVRARRGLVVLGVAGLAGSIAYPVAVQRRAAEQLVTQAEVEQGRTALLLGQSGEAREHLAEAYRRGDRSPGLEFMLARALQSRLAELGRLQSGKGRVWSAAFSPDGQHVVTSDDGGARVWDAASHRMLVALPHGSIVYQAVYSADGTRIATACEDGAVRIWDAATGAQLHELRHEGERRRYQRLTISPDGSTVAAIDAMGEVAHVWDARSGVVLSELTNDGSGVPSIAMSADGRWLVTSGGDDVRVFDTATWTLAMTVPVRGVRCLSFDPTGARLATGSAAGDVSIWSIPSGTRIHRLREAGSSIDAIAFSPDGALIAAASREGTERVWQAGTGILNSEFSGRRRKILSLEFDGSGQLVLASDSNGTAIVSDAASGIPVAVFDGTDDPLMAAHFSPDSRRVLSASFDGTARIWDAAPTYRRSNSGPALIAATGRDAPSPSVSEDVRKSPDGRHAVTIFALAAGGAPMLWDVDSRRVVARLQGHIGRVWSARWVRGGRDILTAGQDGTARLWDGETGQLRRTFRRTASRFLMDAAEDPSGLIVIGGGSDGLLEFWDAANGRPLWTMQAHASHVTSVDFDAGAIVTRGYAGDVARWALPDPAQVIRACDGVHTCDMVTP